MAGTKENLSAQDLPVKRENYYGGKFSAIKAYPPHVARMERKSKDLWLLFPAFLIKSTL